MKNKNYILEIVLIIFFVIIDVTIVLSYNYKKISIENKKELLSLQQSIKSSENSNNSNDDSNNNDDDSNTESNYIQNESNNVNENTGKKEEEHEEEPEDVVEEPYYAMTSNDFIFPPDYFITKNDLDDLETRYIYDPSEALYNEDLINNNKKVSYSDYDHYIKVRAALNELYAMKGFVFSKYYWTDYFCQYGWYKPKEDADVNFEEDKNSWEYNRYITIVDYEREHGWR